MCLYNNCEIVIRIVSWRQNEVQRTNQSTARILVLIIVVRHQNIFHIIRRFNTNEKDEKQIETIIFRYYNTAVFLVMKSSTSVDIYR